MQPLIVWEASEWILLCLSPEPETKQLASHIWELNWTFETSLLDQWMLQQGTAKFMKFGSLKSMADGRMLVSWGCPFPNSDFLWYSPERGRRSTCRRSTCCSHQTICLNVTLSFFSEQLKTLELGFVLSSHEHTLYIRSGIQPKICLIIHRHLLHSLKMTAAFPLEKLQAQKIIQCWKQDCSWGWVLGRTSLPVGRETRLVVGSKVAKSTSRTITSASATLFSSVDLPKRWIWSFSIH